MEKARKEGKMFYHERDKSSPRFETRVFKQQLRIKEITEEFGPVR
jgi:hypothetical protein